MIWIQKKKHFTKLLVFGEIVGLCNCSMDYRPLDGCTLQQRVNQSKSELNFMFPEKVIFNQHVLMGDFIVQSKCSNFQPCEK